jgi:hypothetical protein
VREVCLTHDEGEEKSLEGKIVIELVRERQTDRQTETGSQAAVEVNDKTLFHLSTNVGWRSEEVSTFATDPY